MVTRGNRNAENRERTKNAVESQSYRVRCDYDCDAPYTIDVPFGRKNIPTYYETSGKRNLETGPDIR